jgi:thioredoxin-like negative regulator of GroEL
MLVLAAAIAGGVWFYREKVQHRIAAAAKPAGPRHSVEILHFHQPKNPDSERIADHLNLVQAKYCGQVLVTRLDIATHAERAKAEGVTKTPDVVILAGKERAFEFQGVWPRARIEAKVEEILRGLRRMDKNWMPPGISRR